MKRTLYRHLHRRLRPYSGRWSSRVATAVLAVPDRQVPRWSPGGEWVELQTGRYWALALAPGVQRVMVRTWGREQVGYADSQNVLLSGVLTDGQGSVADKKHRLYTWAEPGTLTADLLTGDHPAEVYWRYFDEVADRFDRLVGHSQDCVDYPATDPAHPGYTRRTLDLRPACELRPDGQSWALSIQMALSPHPEHYWWDLARATDVLAAISRAYGMPHSRLSSREHDHRTEPLWHHGWDWIGRAAGHS